MRSGSYFHDEDFGSMRPDVVVVPGGVLVNLGPPLGLPGVPVLRDMVVGGQIL